MCPVEVTPEDESVIARSSLHFLKLLIGQLHVEEVSGPHSPQWNMVPGLSLHNNVI